MVVGWAIIQYINTWQYYWVIISHDFGLPILSQWQNIISLQFSNSDNILILYYNLESCTLKTRIRKNEPVFATILSSCNIAINH